VRPDLQARAHLPELGRTLEQVTAAPLRASAGAVAAPPIPPPAIMTRVPSRFDIDLSFVLCQ
jgi:hypothetical protein